MRETEKIWFNGELIDWADAKVHVGAHGCTTARGVFEGIRAYETANGPAVFRLTDHLKRLENSARLLRMNLSYSIEELRIACHDVIANGLAESYLRPIAFYGYGELGVNPGTNPVDVYILGLEPRRRGARERDSRQVSSWQRIGPNTIPHVARRRGSTSTRCWPSSRQPERATTKPSC